MRILGRPVKSPCLLLTAGCFLLGSSVWAQAPKTPQASAPTDLTGYWVAVITEDWRFRMVTPPKGDYASIPLNADGRKAADQWDRASDIAAGEQCRVFGAAGIMRMPLRLHVSWQDDSTLKLEIDNGEQVRLFHFDKSAQPLAQASWQGFSAAEWETVGQGEELAPSGRPRPRNQAPTPPPLSGSLTGSLKVITTRMKPGYLRRNGVPYSANARLTEFFDRTKGPHGESWLILTSVVDDPQYLSEPFLLTTHYKLEADGSKFQPRPCEETAPVEGLAARPK